MYRLLGSFRNFILKSCPMIAAVVLVAMSGIVMAQSGDTVTVTMPTISWGTVASQLITTLTSVAVVGIGIGISIWVLMLVPRLFRRSAK
jgi:hypothetical protein